MQRAGRQTGMQAGTGAERPDEVIAKSIGELAKSVRALINGPLNRKALVLLLASSSGQNRQAVENMLMAIERLDSDWLNQPKEARR